MCFHGKLAGGRRIASYTLMLHVLPTLAFALFPELLFDQVQIHLGWVLEADGEHADWNLAGV